MTVNGILFVLFEDPKHLQIPVFAGIFPFCCENLIALTANILLKLS